MRCNRCGRFVEVIGQNLTQYYVICSKCGQSITERLTIETAEQANQLCLDLWYKIIWDIKLKKHSTQYLDTYKFSTTEIKKNLVGEYNWQDDCPLCEFYKDNKGCKACPLRNCYAFGFSEVMTFEQIKNFYKGLQQILVKVR